MAKRATSTATGTATRATKPDAAKAPAPAARTASTATATETAAAPAKGTAVINIDKERHGGTVRGAVNGQRFEFKTDSDIPVTAAQLEALSNSDVKFTTVTPLAGEGAAEGSAASSVATGTATRLAPPVAPETDADGKPVPTPELSQAIDAEFISDAQKVNTPSEGKATDPAAANAAAAKDAAAKTA